MLKKYDKAIWDLTWKFTRTSGLPVEDIHAEAIYRFCLAAKRWDPNRQDASSFSSYALSSMTNGLIRAGNKGGDKQPISDLMLVFVGGVHQYVPIKNVQKALKKYTSSTCHHKVMNLLTSADKTTALSALKKEYGESVLGWELLSAHDKWAATQKQHKALEQVTTEPSPVNITAFHETMGMLSEEARFVAELVLNTPEELMEMVADAPPRTVKRMIRNFLINRGWKRERVKSALGELRTVFAN
jgi:hypothetical protein